MQLFTRFQAVSRIELEGIAGYEILECIKEAIEIAARFSTPISETIVAFDFNGVTVEVTQHSDADNAAVVYRAGLYKLFK